MRDRDDGEIFVDTRFRVADSPRVVTASTSFRDAVAGRPRAALGVGLITTALVTLLACGGDRAAQSRADTDAIPIANGTPEPTPTIADAFTIASRAGPVALGLPRGRPLYLVTFPFPLPRAAPAGHGSASTQTARCSMIRLSR